MSTKLCNHYHYLHYYNNHNNPIDPILPPLLAYHTLRPSVLFLSLLYYK